MQHTSSITHLLLNYAGLLRRGKRGPSDSNQDSTNADSAEYLLSGLIIFAPHFQIISIGFNQFTHSALSYVCKVARCASACRGCLRLHQTYALWLLLMTTYSPLSTPAKSCILRPTDHMESPMQEAPVCTCTHPAASPCRAGLNLNQCLSGIVF